MLNKSSDLEEPVSVCVASTCHLNASDGFFAYIEYTILFTVPICFEIWIEMGVLSPDIISVGCKILIAFKLSMAVAVTMHRRVGEIARANTEGRRTSDTTRTQIVR